MTVVDTHPQRSAHRAARTRHYVMCRPDHFRVDYVINPFMDPSVPVDTERALEQWASLRRAYLDLGHHVDVVEPLAGQPDMVFAANGGLVIGDRAYGARFRFPERAAEGPAFAAWLREKGVDVVEPQHANEGEGDFLALRHVVLAGAGTRTTIAAHVEAAETLHRPVVSLELVDPRFYHLDTALTVLDDGGGDAPADIAYLPDAFSPHSLRTLRELFPDALELPIDDEALVLALNSVSDGRHVVVPQQAPRFAAALADRGYEPVPVDLSELLKSGGSVKCCTMERHR